MAIQLPNAGLGDGKTGDNEFVMWTKVKDNFSNTTHAASQLMVSAGGIVPKFDGYGIENTGVGGTTALTGSELPPNGTIRKIVSSDINLSLGSHWSGVYSLATGGSYCTYLAWGQSTPNSWHIGGSIDGEFTYWAKVYTDKNTKKDSNTKLLLESGDTIPQNSAASRLVGDKSGNVPEVTANGLNGTGIGSRQCRSITTTEGSAEYYEAGSGFYYIHTNSLVANELERHKFVIKHSYAPSGAGFSLLATPYANSFYLQAARSSPTGSEPKWYAPVEIYHTGNTTVDSNKNIKTSSPVVRVFSDHLDKIHEANDLPIEHVKNGIGDYTIKGTTGLRENDWQIVIPKDDHDNQLIAFTMEDNDGEISLKTYKRTFNMQTFMFEPDLSEPLDIPEGRWVDLHFNDLPQEQLDEPIE